MVEKITRLCRDEDICIYKDSKAACPCYSQCSTGYHVTIDDWNHAWNFADKKTKTFIRKGIKANDYFLR